MRRAAPLLRATAFRAVLHPLFALVQLALADREVLERVAVRLFGRAVFKHIRAEHLDECAAVLIIEIRKSLAIKGQKREVTIALIEPAALSRGAAVGCEVVHDALPIELKLGRLFPVGFGLVSVEEVADHAKKLARLLVVERLDGRVVDVVKSKWFYIFLLMFFRGCFTAFRKSRCLRMGVLLSRKQKARRFFCELSAVLFCEGCDVSPSYKSNSDTSFMHTLENFFGKFFIHDNVCHISCAIMRAWI